MTATTGLYGKLPALGDFVTRRVPDGWRDPWDGWLAAVVAAHKQRAPQDWAERFERWPPLCFALDAGLAGPHPAYGLVVPSQDRVGRRFPLTLAVVLDREVDPMQFAIGAERWLRLAIAVLRDLGAPGFDPAGLEPILDELDRILADVAAAPEADLEACTRLLREGGGWQAPLPPAAGLAYHLGSLGLVELRRAARGVGTFWPAAGAGTLLVCAGLPDPAFMAGLLSAHAGSTAAERAAVPPAPTAEHAAPMPAARATPADASREAVLVAAPSVAYFASSGWSRDGVDDVALARRFSETFLRDPDAGRALSAAFGQGAAAGAGSAWVPDEDGGRYAWSGSAAIFRMRGAELVRLTAPAAPAGGGSLADLLSGPSDAGSAQSNVVAADVQDGDRILLCADGSYGKLSWGQLMSALQESRAARAAERLAEIWSRPDTRVPGAIVLAFDLTEEGLEATHAAVAGPVASAAH